MLGPGNTIVNGGKDIIPVLKKFGLDLGEGKGGVVSAKKERHMVPSGPIIKCLFRDFPGGVVVKSPPANAGDMGSSPGPGRSHMPRSN